MRVKFRLFAQPHSAWKIEVVDRDIGLWGGHTMRRNKVIFSTELPRGTTKKKAIETMRTIRAAFLLRDNTTE